MHIQRVQFGKKVQELTRENGISDVTLYNWKKKYSDMQVDELKRLRETENNKLKRIVADLNLVKDLIGKKL